MRLHLVDGTFELFRAHYSKRPEQPLKATLGMTQSLLALLANPAEQVTSARAALLENLQDGCTLYLINRRVTASGQTRFVSPLIITANGSPHYFSWHVAALLGMSYVPGGMHDSIRISAHAGSPTPTNIPTNSSEPTSIARPCTQESSRGLARDIARQSKTRFIGSRTRTAIRFSLSPKG